MNDFETSVDVTSVASMQWNRTISVEMLTAMSGEAGREDVERQAVERGQPALSPDALERIREFIKNEARQAADPEAQVEIEIRQGGEPPSGA